VLKVGGDASCAYGDDEHTFTPCISEGRYGINVGNRRAVLSFLNLCNVLPRGILKTDMGCAR
jgi:hypothetical protein